MEKINEKKWKRIMEGNGNKKDDNKKYMKEMNE